MHLAYCEIKGEFFTVRLTFAQISAMLYLILVAYYTTSFVRETAFSFMIHYKNVSSTVWRLLIIEVMLQKLPFHSLTRLIIILPGVKPGPVRIQFSVEEEAHGTVQALPTGFRCPLSVLFAKTYILVLQDKPLRYQPLSGVKHSCQPITFLS